MIDAPIHLDQYDAANLDKEIEKWKKAWRFSCKKLAPGNITVRFKAEKQALFFWRIFASVCRIFTPSSLKK